MVFDEVDSGIGGAVAEIVGRELRALGDRGQVLCVTHLPQVASQGHHHLRVAKSTDGRTTRTALTELAAQARVEEIARMLGGIEVTGKAREHAREMLRTHLDLPPDPSPTDKMPALTAKDLLAQAKIAARSAKEEGGVEPKVLGGDPRATAAAEPAKGTAVAAKAGKVATAPAKSGEGAAQPGKATPQPVKSGEGAPQPDKAAGAPMAKPTPALEAAPQPGKAAGAPTANPTQDGPQPARATPQPVNDAASPNKATGVVQDTSQPTKGLAAAAKESTDDNVIDLAAAKAASRPAGKRR